MENTYSWAWPNIFNISQNRVSVLTNNPSIVSRCRLLMLTEPSELYQEPGQGVGMKQFMYRYNQGENVKAEIRDRCADQFALHEPSVNAPNTQWVDGLQFTGNTGNIPTVVGKATKLDMTISVETVYGDVVQIDPNSTNQ